jgi:hypothetical protein
MESFRKIGLLALALSAVACGLPDEWDNTPYTPHPVTPEPEEPGVVEFTATVPTKTSLDEESGSVTWVALWREDQLRMWIRILLTSFSVRLPVLLSTMRNRVTAK